MGLQAELDELRATHLLWQVRARAWLCVWGSKGGVSRGRERL